MNLFAKALFALALLALPAGAQTRVYITSGTTFVVPNDWNNGNNTIEIVGAGGVAGPRIGVPAHTVQGGGGAYAKQSNVALTPGSTVTVHFGGTGPDTTWFKSALTILAENGFNGDEPAGEGIGGRASASVGAVKFSGGGGTVATNGAGGGAGAGGAAGLHGAGGNGSNFASFPGGQGDAGFGGAGGFTGSGAGSPGTEWDATHGSGGGAGGAAMAAGGLYGGGSSVLAGTPSGALIVLTYLPLRRVAAGAF